MITHSRRFVNDENAFSESLYGCTKTGVSHCEKRTESEVLVLETVFWKRLTALCAERNTTPTGVCKATGLSTGSPPVWKRGRIPTLAVRQALGAYFGVSADYFLSPEKEAAPERERSEAADKVYFALFHGGEEITDEQYEEVLSFVDYVKAKSRKKE